MSEELPGQEALFKLDDEQARKPETIEVRPAGVDKLSQDYFGFNNFIDAAPRTEVNARAQGRVIE